MTVKKVCVIEGDDAAPEVVRPTVELLEEMGLDIEFLRPITGEEAIEKYGTGFPAEAREAVDSADCTLFGSASGKTGGAIAYLRWGLKTYANVRPVKWLPGFNSPLNNPQGIDYVIIRENLEGLYPSREGEISDLAPLGLVDRISGQPLASLGAGKYAIRIITEENTRNVARYACELALKRKEKGGKGKVTSATKHNMLRQTCGLFREIVEETVKAYPDLTYEYFIVDDFARRLVADPQSVDVVVMPNMFGDILADEAAGTIGGLGLAPSACIGNTYAYFEPVHGTAPDIAGQNIINPTAMILSASMMLDYLGFEDAAQRLEKAVADVYKEGRTLTLDQGGKASTTEFCQAVRSKLV